MIPDAKEFLEIASGKPKKSGNQLATVTRVVSSRPYIKFDGESVESPVLYPYATGLTFATGNRVFMQEINGKYIIAYKITA